MNLATTYLGLALRHPVVASASPMAGFVEGVRRLAGGGAAAIVLPSLFEEDVVAEAARHLQLVDAGSERFAESLSYFPVSAHTPGGATAYLRLVERAAAAVEVPVLASLNGVTPGGWTSYAFAMAEAGAAAIELNLYAAPVEPSVSGRQVEARHLEVFQAVRAAVKVPVAVKLSPQLSSVGEVADHLARAGADGLVLFNRLVYPDIDVLRRAFVDPVALSSPAEGRLVRSWIALLRHRLTTDLAASTGVEEPVDVAKAILAGADVVMTTSSLLRHGPEHLGVLVEGLEGWIGETGLGGLREARGLLALPIDVDETAASRQRYVAALRAANARPGRGW